ncbi:amidohydrolase [Marinibactrum halimedae]|uniref:N-acyl-L-amino acid amidohydrolase n=1 Tax=Marinibactrum halimedae TaxID=1444977 RepID=A0AA37T850_9GAMM|nr:amidohydrolase [Marinibactrum halimedae]MCD9458537.1 amidohydrolase [Marinibactrum halimedae]GLS26597.1 N-acyl-L-amino acid amidohydrolase [Marinibactrum halimedae]
MKLKFSHWAKAATLATCASLSYSVFADDKINAAIAKDYNKHLDGLFEYFHKNPELSLQEHKTAKRLAKELKAAGFKVTQGVGGTGLVAIMKNGDGPMVMMRADMDGLPVEEKSGLDYASKATQKDLITGNVVPVMHACGHDMHITSLVGTARQMAAMKDQWSGTLMLIGQPAEERVLGAKAMMEDNLWERFGTPDYAMALHVSSNIEAGKIFVTEDSPFAGADTVDITIHGVGAHGAYPHAGKDPIVLGSQIVLALQTLVSRELPPRDPGVVTIGSFHSGTKHNIISDKATLQLTVRNTSFETRETLLSGIKRIAENLGRAAGLPDDKLPEVVVSEESVPPTINDTKLARRLHTVWTNKMGADALTEHPIKGMGAEDYPFFTTEPYIPSVYFQVGGTPKADFERAKAGGPPVPSHHSPLFKIEPESSVKAGVAATVYALLDLMKK